MHNCTCSKSNALFHCYGFHSKHVAPSTLNAQPFWNSNIKIWAHIWFNDNFGETYWKFMKLYINSNNSSHLKIKRASCKMVERSGGATWYVCFITIRPFIIVSFLICMHILSSKNWWIHTQLESAFACQCNLFLFLFCHCHLAFGLFHRYRQYDLAVK